MKQWRQCSVLAGEPKPRALAQITPKQNWRCRSVLSVESDRSPFSSGFEHILQMRRTVRSFGALSLAELLTFLHYVRRTLSVNSAGRWRKPSVSAGGLHSLDVIVAGGPGISHPLVYDDTRAQFLEIDEIDTSALGASLARLRLIAPKAEGHTIVYAAQLDRLSSGYEEFEALAFRDAGALDQLLSMSAYDAGLAFVPLGSNADDIVESICGEDMNLAGVGCAILGRPSAEFLSSIVTNAPHEVPY